MKKTQIIFLLLLPLLYSCSNIEDYPFDEIIYGKTEARENMQKVFGETFDTDWKTTNTVSLTVNVDGDREDVSKLMILTNPPFGGNHNAGILNGCEVQYGDQVTLQLEVPKTSSRLYATLVFNDGTYYVKGFDASETSLSFREDVAAAPASRRQLAASVSYKLQRSAQSYNKERWMKGVAGYEGWENDSLYLLSDGDEQKVMVTSPANYDNDFIADIRACIFSYLPQKQDNLPMIQESGYYNEDCYLTTTGKEPIVVYPIYRNDGTSSEAANSHLYYYYYNPEELGGLSEEEQVQFLKDLPKYKAVQMWRTVKNLPNDTIVKKLGYQLLYFGDTKKPVLKTTAGTVDFPAGYRLGFMSRCLHGKANKRGEVYADGRLNKGINMFGDYASSGFGDSDPRMAWVEYNKKLFLCVETGSDRDFNDVVFEISGGVESFNDKFDAECNGYTFCYEDTRKGDYDLNDVVIRAKRISATQIEYAVLACGASDELYIYNVEGKTINKKTEVHELFGVYDRSFINTQRNRKKFDYVLDTIDVPWNYTILSNPPAVYNKTKNILISLSLEGQDPHAVMIPIEFEWPLERVCVKDAYANFITWAKELNIYEDWYNEPETDKVYDK
ncbi:MAG: DUF4842 domain-containing protein [Bacteroidales bacterium]|nr:DUF4842 domain-containing protein [Bacteroidales bacterium]